MKLLFGNTLWHLLVQSDNVTKAIMLGLLMLSIVCWTIILHKWMQFNEKSKQLAELTAKLERVHGMHDFTRFITASEKLFGGQLIVEYTQSVQAAADKKRELQDHERDALDEQRYSSVEEAVFEQWSQLPILFVAAACSPLIGLFGTVWGLMHAFMSISQKQTADIVTVAPGIAEALLTTLAGLMVAIPALIMYHYFVSRIRQIEHELYQLSDNLARVSRALLLDVRG